MKRRIWGQYHTLKGDDLTRIGILTEEAIEGLANAIGHGRLSGFTLGNGSLASKVALSAGWAILKTASGVHLVSTNGAEIDLAGQTAGTYYIVATVTEVSAANELVNPPPQTLPSGTANPFYDSRFTSYNLDTEMQKTVVLSYQLSPYTPSGEEAVIGTVQFDGTNITNITTTLDLPTPLIADYSIKTIKLNSDVAGAGLGMDTNNALKVNVDNSTIEIVSDILRVKDQTLNPTLAPTSDTADLNTLLSNFANRIQAITGGPDWKTNPATTISELNGSVTRKGVNETVTGAWVFTSQVSINRLRITSGGGVSLSSTLHGLQIGSDTGLNLRFDINDIQAVNNGSPSALNLNASGGSVYINQNIAWHAGNDGAGSGLDADLLDGYDSSAFPRKAENATVTGSWVFTASHIFRDNIYMQSASGDGFVIHPRPGAANYDFLHIAPQNAGVADWNSGIKVYRATGNVDILKDLNALAALNVTGATTLSSTLGVTGNTTIGGTLNVTGAVTLSNSLSVSGDLIASTKVRSNRLETIAGGLTLSGGGYGMVFEIDTDNNSADNYIWKGNGVEIMRLTDTGNLGIGTTSPAYMLDVAGTARVNGFLYISPADTVNEGGELVLSGAGSNPTWHIDNYAGTVRFFDSGGFVALAVSSNNVSASTKITAGNGKGFYAPKDNDVGRHIGFRATGTFEAWFETYNNSGATFERLADVVASGLRIKTNDGTGDKVFFSNLGNSYINSGNLGIGTTTPGFKLHVVSASSPAVFIDRSTGWGGISFGANGVEETRITFPSDGSGDLTFEVGGVGVANEAMRIKGATKRVGIGTSSPTDLLHVAGGATIDATLKVSTVSLVKLSSQNNYFRFSSAISELPVSNGSHNLLLLKKPYKVEEYDPSTGTWTDITANYSWDSLTDGGQSVWDSGVVSPDGTTVEKRWRFYFDLGAYQYTLATFRVGTPHFQGMDVFVERSTDSTFTSPFQITPSITGISMWDTAIEIPATAWIQGRYIRFDITGRTANTTISLKIRELSVYAHGTTYYGIRDTWVHSWGVNGEIWAKTGGSATSPAYSFGNDSNTGIYNPAADTIAISTGGTERLRVSGGQFKVYTTTTRGIWVSRSGVAAVNTPAEIYFDRTAAGSQYAAAVGMDADPSRAFFIWVNGADRLKIDAITGEATFTADGIFSGFVISGKGLKFVDTRSTDIGPFDYQGVSIHLKYNTTDGLSDGGVYHGVLHLTQWPDSTGGRPSQLGFTSNKNIWFRQHNGTAWTGWSKLWHSDNDGAGSGLDADLLDGYDSSAFARKAENATITGAWDVNNKLKVNQLAVEGITASRGITQGSSIELSGSTSSALLSVQDGNGQIQLKWNATYGINETFLTSNEPAAKWEFDPSNAGYDLFAIKYGTVPGTAGSTIVWSSILNIGTISFTYKGADVWTNANNVVSKATSGYIKLANGWILQWGVASGANGTQTITFPIAFPTSAVVIVSGSQNTNYLLDTDTIGAKIISNSQAQIVIDANYSRYWIAIGY